MQQSLTIAFWNVYNLLREGVHPIRGPKSFVERQAKIRALAAVIGKLANGHPPDILVLSEVGDAQLITELTNSLKLGPRTPPHYVFEPPNASNDTGIVVLALTSNVATIVRIDAENRANRPRSLSVKVELSSPGCPPLYLIACHWKSDRPVGNPRQDRQMSGRWLNDHLNGNAPNGKADAVVVIGDFNIEPYAPEISQSEGLYATRHFQKSIRANGVRLFNCMWPWLVDPQSWTFVNAQIANPPQVLTSHGRTEPRLFDQVLVSRSILKAERFSLEHVDYFCDGCTAETLPQTRTLVPKPWTWDDLTQVGSGTSDHFPLIATLLY
jgi:endonuclease/exonuclease/phosphatase family metal-dependent hydrolase